MCERMALIVLEGARVVCLVNITMKLETCCNINTIKLPGLPFA